VNARLFTARQVAEEFGVSTETILRWTRRGELPAIKLPGGAIRFRETDLEAWLGEHETGAAVRGVSATRADRAGASVRSLTSRSSATPPRDAATTEED
jgi:excisionase family DNA binding protein